MSQIEKSLEKAGQLIIDKMIDTLYENKSVVTGRLARSIESEVVPTDNGYKLQILMEQYGEYVDNGAERGPGRQPPVAPILEWLKLRQISIPTGFTTKSFAFVIARKIGSKGQQFKKPKPFITPSVDFVVNEYLPKVLEDATAEVIYKELDLK